MNNAAYSLMQNRNALMGLTRNAGSFGNMNALRNAETRLQLDSLQNQWLYSAAELMEDSQRKLQKENIKRTFSTFA